MLFLNNLHFYLKEAANDVDSSSSLYLYWYMTTNMRLTYEQHAYNYILYEMAWRQH